MLNEAEFESELIRYLETVGNTKQWEYRPDIKTTEQLWQNFREILERNNQEALRGHPLTDGEFAQVQREICDLKTPYDADDSCMVSMVVPPYRYCVTKRMTLKRNP